MSEDVYPPDEELIAWYQCGRKVPHRTYSGAEMAALDVWKVKATTENPPGVYECERCGMFHVGRVGAEVKSPYRLVHAARRAWHHWMLTPAPPKA